MRHQKQAILVADLGFGDAGKGTITDYLAEQLSAPTVVRYNGGPQAAHTVVTADGRQHTFAQFGSGTFQPQTKTFLSRFMLINPLNMLQEARHLDSIGINDALQRTIIDQRAPVITPFQKAANRLREIARGEHRHGSCGEGIGECMADSLTYGNAILDYGDLLDRATLLKKLRFLREAKYQELAACRQHLPDTEIVRRELAIFTDPANLEACIDVYAYFANTVKMVTEAEIRTLFSQTGTIIFEGAQGVLLDENYAFAPYSTWSTTTYANAETLLQENGYNGEITRLGVLRAYATRHGAGPFPTEDQALTSLLPDQQNIWNPWQQTFRVGYFDLVTARYASEVLGKVDALAITNLDRLESISAWKVCTAYRFQGVEMELDPYFEHQGRHITKIKVHQPADLMHQENLTKKLMQCLPVYQSFPRGDGTQHTPATLNGYLSLIEETLSVPITLTSFGPTSQDKQDQGLNAVKMGEGRREAHDFSFPAPRHHQ